MKTFWGLEGRMTAAENISASFKDANSILWF